MKCLQSPFRGLLMNHSLHKVVGVDDVDIEVAFFEAGDSEAGARRRADRKAQP